MDRNIIDYLPPVLKGYRELKAVTHGEQPEFELLWKAKENVANNQSIVDATEYGVSRWEKSLGIPSKPTESMEDRKTRLLIRMNEQLPYTRRVLKRQLEAICGTDRFTLDVKSGLFLVSVRLKEVSSTVYIDVFSMLDRIVPADMLIDLVVEHELPVAYVYISAQTSSPILKTVIDGDLYFSSSMTANITVTPQASPAIRKTVIGGELVFTGDMKINVNVHPEISLYRRINI